MDVLDAVRSRLEVREFSDETVDEGSKRKVLEAARFSSSGKNLQHWKFILLDEEDDLRRLAEISTTGRWVRGADFAVVVLTDPQYSFHEIDAGRAITQMQFVAFEEGIGSCIYTGFDESEMRTYLNIPQEYHISAVVGFGNPARKLQGEKNRKALEQVVFDGRFDQPLN